MEKTINTAQEAADKLVSVHPPDLFANLRPTLYVPEALPTQACGQAALCLARPASTYGHCPGVPGFASPRHPVHAVPARRRSPRTHAATEMNSTGARVSNSFFLPGTAAPVPVTLNLPFSLLFLSSRTPFT